MRWCDLDVAGDPIPKGRPRRGKNGHTYTPARTIAAEKALAWEFKVACTRPTALPCCVRLQFRCATYRRCDIDNLTKLVLDSGNGIVWVDDQQVVELHVELIRGCIEPGTRITVDTVHIADA